MDRPFFLSGFRWWNLPVRSRPLPSRPCSPASVQDTAHALPWRSSGTTGSFHQHRCPRLPAHPCDMDRVGLGTNQHRQGPWMFLVGPWGRGQLGWGPRAGPPPSAVATTGSVSFLRFPCRWSAPNPEAWALGVHRGQTEGAACPAAITAWGWLLKRGRGRPGRRSDQAAQLQGGLPEVRVGGAVCLQVSHIRGAPRGGQHAPPQPASASANTKASFSRADIIARVRPGRR